MTTGDRIESQSFCYDPEFPPDVAEGLPLRAARAGAQGKEPRLRRWVSGVRSQVPGLRPKT